MPKYESLGLLTGSHKGAKVIKNADLDILADKVGITRSKLVNMAVEIIANLPPEFILKMIIMRDARKIPPEALVSNLLARFFAPPLVGGQLDVSIFPRRTNHEDGTTEVITGQEYLEFAKADAQDNIRRRIQRKADRIAEMQHIREYMRLTPEEREAKFEADMAALKDDDYDDSN